MPPANRHSVNRSGERTRRSEDSGPLRFAFADPPYPGQSRRLYGNHPDYAGEVDHRELVTRLMTYDGWILCSGGAMVLEVGNLCPPGTRIMPWVKPMTPMKAGVSVDFGWEPVFLYGGRRRNRRAPLVRDWLMCGPARHRGISQGVEAERNEGAVIGMKPQAFCYWTFDCLGARPGDTLDDLFPGSGTVSAAWDSYIRQPGLWTVDASDGEQETMPV